MKTIALVILSFSITYTGWSQSAYQKAMQAGMDSLNNIKEIEDFQTVANQFERISKQENDQWLPSYYVAYCYIIMSFKCRDNEKKEAWLETAEQHIDQALETAPEEAELYVIKGMHYQAIITMDPANNGQTYSQLASEAFQKALELDADNPRAYYLMASNIMYTPEAYGGGMQAACPMFQKAKELYDKESNIEEFMPSWGKNEVEGVIGKCTNE